MLRLTALLGKTPEAPGISLKVTRDQPQPVLMRTLGRDQAKATPSSLIHPCVEELLGGRRVAGRCPLCRRPFHTVPECVSSLRGCTLWNFLEALLPHVSKDLAVRILWIYTNKPTSGKILNAEKGLGTKCCSEPSVK